MPDVALPPAQTDSITAGPGGVMTDEVGVITGDLTIQTTVESGASGAYSAVVRAQYKDAAEWYVVTGGRVPLTDPADVTAVHKLAVGLLHRPQG